MSVKTGDKAPVFSLYNTNKELVALENFRGKNVVLIFFPMAFTRVCTAELCSMRDNMNVYERLNAQVLGISVDSLYTLDRFKTDQNLNFPLLSDFNKEVSKAYGSLYEEFAFGMKGVSKRSAFIIDKEGAIRYAEVLESAGDLPNFEAMQETLSKLN
ncbi:MAG: peroxiredoxin [Saprospiraceae bacterium]|nr:peroxiredoxin [Saprospiraceae bacterium]